MFCVVYSAGAMGPAILDPELGHQPDDDGARRRRSSSGASRSSPGDTITTEATVKDVYDKNGMKFYVFESESKNQDGRDRP